MVKEKQMNILHNVLTVFVFLAPVLGSGLEKSTAVYASLCMFAFCVGYRIFKEKYIVITKTFLLSAAIWLFSFIQLFWASDKGSQLQLSALFLVSACASLVMGDCKNKIGKDNLSVMWTRLMYPASFIYAVCAILYQIFIDSRFLGSAMDFGSGSPTAAACLMVLGMVSANRVFKNNKKQPLFYVSVALMVYVFLMTKSFLGYMFCAALLFAHAMKQKHKKAEAFALMVVTAVLGVLNGVYAVASLIKNPELFNGSIKGLLSIIGVGAGGYNAAVSVVDKGYTGFPPVCSFFLEAFGIIGVVVIALYVMAAVRNYVRTKSFDDIILMFLVIAMFLSESSALVFMLPLVTMFLTARDEGVEIRLHKWIGLVTAVPVCFSLLFTLAHIPYVFANHHWDMGRYSESASCYSVGATMELVNSHGWEKAYLAEQKAFEETGVGTRRSEFLSKAAKYNKKDYMYQRNLADVYTSEGDYLKAFEIWEGIILRHDKEYLYPMYAEKICDVMANCPVGLEKTEMLYNSLNELAKKSTDKDIILSVNNILARSQQYYVNAREGGVMGDMYTETVENVTEVEYESGNTES